MQSDPSHIIDQLDLKKPADLLIALHHLRTWPVISPMDGDDKVRHDLEFLECCAPHIFGCPDNEHTASQVRRLLDFMGGSKPSTIEGYAIDTAPREWLMIFREAFRRGEIGPIALGAAFRYLVAGVSGNGVPGCKPDSLDARRIMLADLRNSSPIGLMDEHERKLWGALPERVTVYRGGCLKAGERIADKALALHWSFDREYAYYYLLKRCTALGDEVRQRQAFPFLLSASVPEDVIGAYLLTSMKFNRHGTEQIASEVLVDFEKLTPEMVENITPSKYRRAA